MALGELVVTLTVWVPAPSTPYLPGKRWEAYENSDIVPCTK